MRKKGFQTFSVLSLLLFCKFSGFFVRLFAFGGEINYSFSFKYKASVLSVFAH